MASTERFARLRLRAESREVMSLHEPDNAQHIAQFYENDDVIVANAANLAVETFKQRDAVMIIATRQHLDAMEARIRGAGIDLDEHRIAGRYTALDAAETLSTFLIDGAPDAAKFDRTVGATLRAAIARSTDGFAFAFGEMVALLCAANRRDGAVHLERLWNVLAAQHRFSLYCAYPIGVFGTVPDVDALLSICSEHSLAIPVERMS